MYLFHSDGDLYCVGTTKGKWQIDYTNLLAAGPLKQHLPIVQCMKNRVVISQGHLIIRLLPVKDNNTSHLLAAHDDACR